MRWRGWTALAWSVTVAWIAVLLCSLKAGWLNRFFYDTDHPSNPGIDFFSVERGWLNLVAHHSEFDTFHSSYGPYATWLNYHPLLVVLVGPVLMFFAPFTAYAVWTGISTMLMGLAAWVLAAGSDLMRKALVFLLLVGAFPTFILLQSGNVQALLVLSLALVFAALQGLRVQPESRIHGALLLAGLLLSLFSKPIVLALLPLLLLMRETRRVAVGAIGTYLALSYLSLTLPAWNPEPISWEERWMWITHPQLIAQTMNVYTNHFDVIRPMRDNAVHWFAMVGVSDFRFIHVDIYSLSALVDGWLHTHTPNAFYRLPVLLLLEVSALVALVRDRSDRMEAALMVAMATPLLLILSYGVVWEYHYTVALPIAAVMLVRARQSVLERCVLGLGVLCWLPGCYVLLRTQAMESLHVQTLLRAERVGPVLLMFLLLVWQATRVALDSTSGLRIFAHEAGAVEGYSPC